MMAENEGKHCTQVSLANGCYNASDGHEGEMAETWKQNMKFKKINIMEII